MKHKKLISKNIFSFLLFYLMAAKFFSVNALIAKAGPASGDCGTIIGIYCNPIESKVSDIPDAIIIVILFLFSFVGIISLLFIIISGIKYIFSIGDEEKMKSAKESLSTSIIGLVIAFLAYGILSIVYNILNG